MVIPDLNQSEFTDLGQSKPEGEPNELKKPTSSGMNIYSLNILGLCVLLLSVPYSSNACSHTLFVNSQNKICTDKDCQIEHHGLLSLTYGAAVCFKMSDDTSLTIKLTTFDYFAIYKPLYYTSSSELRCQGAGQCFYSSCKYEGSEKSKKDLNTFLKNRNDYPNKTGFPMGEDCVEGSLNCYTCTRGSECAFINWVIVPIGDLFTVYTHSFSGW